MLQVSNRRKPLRLISLKPEDYELSDDVPDNYDTVEHWWTTKEPEAVSLLSDPLGTFHNDAEQLQTICEERGIKFLWVKAGRAFQRLGLNTVRAFPIWLLTEFYPLNP